MKVVPLVSGGLDSTVMMYRELLTKGSEVYPLTINYGQKNINREVIAVKKCFSDLVAKSETNQKQRLKPIKYLDMSNARDVYKSGITWDEISIPDRDEMATQDKTTRDPTTVPFRNFMLISLGIAYADLVDADQVLIASHAPVDMTIKPHADSTDQFVNDMSKIIESTCGDKKITLRAPFSKTPKNEVIKMGSILKVPMESTYGCYRQSRYQCGKCPSCFERRRAFKDAGITDETIYIDDPRAKGCCG